MTSLLFCRYSKPFISNGCCKIYCIKFFGKTRIKFKQFIILIFKFVPNKFRPPLKSHQNFGIFPRHNYKTLEPPGILYHHVNKASLMKNEVINLVDNITCKSRDQNIKQGRREWHNQLKILVLLGDCLWKFINQLRLPCYL